MEIVQQTTALTDHGQKPTTTVIVLLMSLEMLSELIDLLGKQSYLHLGTTRVFGMGTVRFD